MRSDGAVRLRAEVNRGQFATRLPIAPARTCDNASESATVRPSRVTTKACRRQPRLPPLISMEQSQRGTAFSASSHGEEDAPR